MTNWRVVFILVALVLGGGRAYDWFQSRQQSKKMMLVQHTPQARSEFGAPENCKAKKICITVFVAPWCSACKISQPTFKALSEYLPKHRGDVGFGIVVGGASPAEHMAEQKLLTPIESYADDEGLVLKNRNIQAFPTWIVNDSSGKEILRKSGGLNISGDEQVQMLLSQFLQI